MIEREEVLHVASLSRLILSEAEIEAMQRDLGSVLDHIETIGELDLSNVAPTAHVIGITGALRPDEATQSLPREQALASAPAAGDEGFLVPSPQA